MDVLSASSGRDALKVLKEQSSLDIVLMVDTSMSTYKELDYIKEAAAHVIRQVVRPGDRMSVFEFDSAVTQLSEFIAAVPKLQAAVRDAMPGTGTSLYDAVYIGSGALRRTLPGAAPRSTDPAEMQK